MTKPTTTDPTGSDAHDETLARLYRVGADEAPPPALDAAILAQARRAVAPARGGIVKRWAVPFSLAATVVLSVGVVLRLAQQGALEPERVTTMAEAPAAAPAPKPDDQAKESQRYADAKLEARTRAAASAEGADRVAPAAPAKPSLSIERDVASEPEQALVEAAPVPEAVAPESTTKAKVGDRADGNTRLAKRAETKPATLAVSKADIESVRARGAPGAYTLVVRIRSTETGCRRYADWWEVVTEDGRLMHRQLLARPAERQPFESASAPLALAPTAVVWVRAHMSDTGYRGAAWKGSVQQGFAPATPPADFAGALATQPPQPDSCNE